MLGMYASTQVFPSEASSYLTFAGDDDFTIDKSGGKTWNGILEYSTDAVTWTVWDGIATLSSDNKFLYVRGSGNSVITGNISTTNRLVITGANVECHGNIMTLVNWESVDAGIEPTMGAHCFSNLFHNNSNLKKAPELPATTLVERCYYQMFFGTGLTTAPDLPATTLAAYCYYGMFRETGLTVAPSLPATTLTSNCYYGMFYNTSLTVVPELPATTLDERCYSFMLYGCTNLKVSDTQVGEYQYGWRIPTASTGTTATNWNNNMIGNTGGTFKSNPDINTTYYVTSPPI